MLSKPNKNLLSIQVYSDLIFATNNKKFHNLDSSSIPKTTLTIFGISTGLPTN